VGPVFQPVLEVSRQMVKMLRKLGAGPLRHSARQANVMAGKVESEIEHEA
jgi:hypothetical protein